MISIEIINDQHRFEDFDKENPYGSDRVEKFIAQVARFEPKLCLFEFFKHCYGYNNAEAKSETNEFWDDDMVVIGERTKTRIELHLKHYGSGLDHEIVFNNLSGIFGDKKIADGDVEAIVNL